MKETKEKAFSRRNELISAALLEFGEKGYENSSLNNILKEAEISKGTFYYHYENKEDLYMSLMDIIVEEKVRFLSEKMDSINDNKDIFTKLKLTIKLGMDFARKNPEIHKFSQGFIKGFGTQCHNEIIEKYYISRNEYLEGLIGRYDFESIDYVGGLIEEGYDKGEIRQDLPKEFTKQIVNYLFYNLRLIVNASNLEEYEKAANYLVDFIKDGLENSK